ncbi:DUF2339 domain-containing protein [Corynebacterium epidermidicanis]|uniref:Membrane protein (DUF2339) n=1 Tax=Corynebacterium epidermidicanis TaxID=1050174 RepID=A0A0G3GTY8_9CORY|nr:DUF2339 domain-containing protein [Corynebacterium epidermidicanis]AKK03018.1 hypothetical protein CEPID_05770 [Corynebacterium epidermidicanis]
MNSNIDQRAQLQRIAQRLNTAEAALTDVRHMLAELYEHTTAPTSTPVQSAPEPPKPTPVAAPPKPVDVTPWWRKEANVIKLVAVGGVLITLAGVGLLVALAIQNGLLGPLGRVIGAWALAGVFLIGAILVHRKGWSVPGRNALAITSLLTAQTTICATTLVLEWWPGLVGSLACLACTATFAGLARWWRDEILTILGLVGATIPTLMLVRDGNDYFVPLFAPFMLMFVASLQLGWSRARIISSVGTLATFTLNSLTVNDVNRSLVNDSPIMAGALALFFALGVLADRIPTRATAERLAAIATPVLLLAIGVALRSKPYASLLALLVILSCGVAFHFMLGRRTPVTAFLQRPGAVTMASAFPVFYLAHWWYSPPAGDLALFSRPLYVVLFFLIASAAAWGLKLGNQPWFWWAGSSLVISWELGRAVLAKSPVWLTGASAAIQALAIIALISVVLLKAKKLNVLSGCILLYFSSLVVVTLTTFLFHLVGGQNGMWLGYLVGHAMVSIGWMLLAAYLLIFDLSRPINVGLILAIAASVKLIFFDLGALEGVPRVIAFLISGIALLVIATLRSKRMAQR